MTRFVATLPFVFVNILTATSATDPNADLLKAMQGKWEVTAAYKAGKKASDQDIRSFQILIEGNRLIMTNGEKKGEETTFKIDATKKPVWMDSMGKDGAVRVRGILSPQGETLTLCSHKSADKRPSEINTNDPKAAILVLKRIK